jgi:putative ABC transport system substrate-binding protein
MRLTVGWTVAALVSQPREKNEQPWVDKDEGLGLRRRRFDLYRGTGLRSTGDRSVRLKMANRRTLLCFAGSAALLPQALRAGSGGPKKVIWLANGDAHFSEKTPASVREKSWRRIRETFRSRGIIEGRDIALTLRGLPADNEKEADRLADSLVRERPDIIVLASHFALWSLKQRTRDIPVVFYNVGYNPVEIGLVESLSRPGGNITGTTQESDEFMLKTWQLFKQLVPSMKRASIVIDTRFWEDIHRKEPGWSARYSTMWGDIRARLGIEITWVRTPNGATADEIAVMVRESRAEGVYLAPSTPREGADFLFSAPIPTLCYGFAPVKQGCLMGSGTDWTEGETYAVQAVQRILGGESPAVIPVYRTNVDFALNRRRARELQIDIPKALLIGAREIYD